MAVSVFHSLRPLCILQIRVLPKRVKRDAQTIIHQRAVTKHYDVSGLPAFADFAGIQRSLKVRRVCAVISNDVPDEEGLHMQRIK